MAALCSWIGMFSNSMIEALKRAFGSPDVGLCRLSSVDGLTT
jgi:hypothetical protein